MVVAFVHVISLQRKGAVLYASRHNVYVVFPGDGPSFEVNKIVKPQIVQFSDELLALDPYPAEHDNLAIPRDLRDPAHDLALGDTKNIRCKKLADRAGFVDFQEEKSVAGFKPSFELADADGS